MVTERKEPKYRGLMLLASLMLLVFVAQAAYPSADLSISKVAQVNGVAVEQVVPNQTFNYNITVQNNDLTNNAPDVVVTDKLPYNVIYVGAVSYPASPINYTITKSGDLVYVNFGHVAKNSARYINITVTAPNDSPTILYNIVNLRYGNDPVTSNNSMTISTCVPSVGYNRTIAAKSFEDLLHNQSKLLFDFEGILNTIPLTNEENYTFITSFEQLLRSQAVLTSSFGDLLNNSTNTGWDPVYTSEDRIYLLDSYERMLWDEAFLFASFNMKLHDSCRGLCSYTASGHTQDAPTEFLASFEDLLKRQTRLYKSFNLLLIRIQPDVSYSDMIDFLAAYENLLRVESNLLMDFNDLLVKKYKTFPPCI